MVGAMSFEPKIGRRLGRPHRLWDPLIRSPVDRDDDETEEGGGGVRWAVLVAGSNGYGNYRHQVIFLIMNTPIVELKKKKNSFNPLSGICRKKHHL